MGYHKRQAATSGQPLQTVLELGQVSGVQHDRSQDAGSSGRADVRRGANDATSANNRLGDTSREKH